MPKLIKHWEELVGLESEKYKLIVNERYGGAWIKPKVETEETQENYCEHHMYLSTHTFYGSTYKWSTETLQKFGFDVEIDNWDKKE